MIAAILAWLGMWFFYFYFQLHSFNVFHFDFLKVENFKDKIPTYNARGVDDLDVCSSQVLQQVSQGTITRSTQQEYAASTFDAQ